MRLPKISVIVPCYNYGKYISQTLDSIKNQSFQDWECIIVDDGSTDNSQEVINAYTSQDARFIYIYQENKGLPGARNTGIAISKGKFIQFLDSDDLLEKDKLKFQFDYISKHKNIDLVYSDLMYFNDGDVEKLRYSMDWINFPWTLKKSGSGRDLLKHFIISTPILVPMPILKKSSVLQIGGFTENLKSCEDWDFWFRFAFEGFDFKYLNKKDTRSLVRVHSSSMTQNRSRMITSMIEVRNLFSTRLIDKKLRKINNKFLINNHIELAILKKEFETTTHGKEYLDKINVQFNSIRIKIFSYLLRIASPNFNYLLLKTIKTAMKKYYGFKH